MSIEQDLTALKAKGEKLNTLRIETATKLQGLEQDTEKLVAEAQALGIAPDKLEEVFKTEDAAIKVEAARLDTELTRVLGEISAIQ